jgi:hypothetical protein
MGYGSFLRDPWRHERHKCGRSGGLPILPWAGLEGPAFSAGLGDRNPHPGRGRYCPANVPGLRRLRAGGDSMTANLAQSDAARMAVAQFVDLAVDLNERGFLAVMLREQDGKLILRVTSQDTPSCREDITTAADDGGAWWFLWSWGDPIALTGDVAAAAFKIAYVLTPQADG